MSLNLRHDTVKCQRSSDQAYIDFITFLLSALEVYLVHVWCNIVNVSFVGNLKI